MNMGKQLSLKNGHRTARQVSSASAFSVRMDGTYSVLWEEFKSW